eukprot:TRINITY_DN5519_c0_g1_i1.p1 TRINITY_DN5519_c0_g1~~TRINITY_DN5519_c0_g1_i1.p1  ORF type:complete len:355 (-),score=57.67 TRINITY_DN5519_c0_g1_i1:268-1332(-)
MAKLANAFMMEEDAPPASPPKMWSAISRLNQREPSKPAVSCPQMNMAPQPDSSNFVIQQQVGVGSGGTTVHQCLDTVSGKLFALKVVPRADYQPSPTEAMLMDQWEAVHSILPTHVMTKGSSTYMSMELAAGGDLLEHILKSGCVAEAQVAKIVQKLATALSNLHRTMGVCHRDIKPENICIADPNDVTSVRLCDFEHARPLFRANHVYAEHESLGSDVGSLDYMAPERFYGVAAGAAGDCWGIGVVTYCLLRGELPFVAALQPSDRQRPKMRVGVWDGMAPGAVSLISGLLDANPETRMTMDDVLDHEWVISKAAEHSVQDKVSRAHSQAVELSRLAHLSQGLFHPAEQDCKA